jgi:VWFA-related protein
MRALVLTAAAAAISAATSAQVVFRSGVASVSVDVSVQQRGREVVDLTADDFELLDNDLPQRILDVGREALPIDITFVVDVSGSVTGPLQDAIRRAIGAVGERLRDIDRTAVVEFNHRVREIRPLSPTNGPMAIILGSPAGSTSLFDAVGVSLLATAEPSRRRMAIVFTDGRDDTSFIDAESLVEVAKRSQMAVFTVAVAGGSSRRPERAAHEAVFSALAEVTGGTAVVMQQDQDLSTSFVRAFDEFRTSYVLRYAYEGPQRSGWHAITVRVKRPGTFEVRARPGYFAAGEGPT